VEILSIKFCTNKRVEVLFANFDQPQWLQYKVISVFVDSLDQVELVVVDLNLSTEGLCDGFQLNRSSFFALLAHFVTVGFQCVSFGQKPREKVCVISNVPDNFIPYHCVSLLAAIHLVCYSREERIAMRLHHNYLQIVFLLLLLYFRNLLNRL